MAKKQIFKRRPNKAGTVVKLSGKRRKPYCAKITAGRDQITGRQIQKSIGTYETWEEADDALTLYRLNKRKMISDQEAMSLAPATYNKLIELRNKSIPTFKEIYDLVYEEDLCKLATNTTKGYINAAKHFKSIYNIKINNISLAMLQDLFDNDSTGHGMKSLMKILCAKIFKYAVIHKYISRDDDYVEYIRLGEYKESTLHYAFTNREIKALINDGSLEAKIVLIYIFTGVRANELLNLPKENITISEISYFVTGIKTTAGKNRIIPIHDFIKPFFIEIMQEDRSDTIINYSYDNFRRRHFSELMKKLGMTHTMHDTRDTFATLCQENNIDIFIRKRILGHKMRDITFDTYTTTVIETLYREVNKIKIP